MSDRPTFTKLGNIGEDGKKQHIVVEYATEQELLDFANAVRKAGGGNVLEALLPSVPEEPNACLIANALNFGCSVSPGHQVLKSGKWTGQCYWFMHLFAEEIDEATVSRIAEAIGTDYELTDSDGISEWKILLPQHIGNVADAFDHQQGWTTKYVRDEES